MLPEMSPRQFLVVHLLFAGPQTARQLRAKLHSAGVAISPPSFSRLMQRMQVAAYVHTVYEPSGSDGGPRRYQLTDLGLNVWQRVREFYAGTAGPPPELVTVATDLLDLAHLSPKRRNEVLLRRVRRQFQRTLSRLEERRYL